jgi:hypothetical protein
VQTRLKRKKVVLSAVCALGAVVFVLAGLRGILRHESPVGRSHVAIADPPAPVSSVRASGAAAPVEPPQPPLAPANAEPRPATASPAKRAAPAPAPTGVVASPARAPKASRSKGSFDPATL